MFGSPILYSNGPYEYKFAISSYVMLQRQTVSFVCYCHLPVSGRRMQRFLQFRLGCHGLPIATGRFAGAAHVDRAQRVCLSCNAGALGDERHLMFECTALASLRSRYAGLFTSSTDTMRSFFAQPDRMGVFHYVIDCLDFMKI